MQNNDYISRQAAIDEIARFAGYIDDDMIYRVQMALRRLRHINICESTQNNELPINTWAHRLMAYIPVGLNNAERIGEYNIIYHGDRLYSIRRVDKDAVVLLHADSPHEAWNRRVTDDE